MKIVRFVLGPFMTNTYIAYNENSREAVVVDPSFYPEKYIAEIRKRELVLRSILITHAHIDHMAGWNELRREFSDALSYMDKRDRNLLENPQSNLSFMVGDCSFKEPDVWISAGDHIKSCGFDFEVIDVAGHTPGGDAFYEEKESVLFTGDALFQGSIGRTDFPGGDTGLLLENIRNHIFTLPETVSVLSGHGDVTTVGEEKRNNPFFKGGMF